MTEQNQKSTVDRLSELKAWLDMDGMTPEAMKEMLSITFKLLAEQQEQLAQAMQMITRQNERAQALETASNDNLGMLAEQSNLIAGLLNRMKIAEIAVDGPRGIRPRVASLEIAVSNMMPDG